MKINVKDLEPNPYRHLDKYPVKRDKFLKRQIKVQSIIAETQASYLELDEVFTESETANMLSE